MCVEGVVGESVSPCVREGGGISCVQLYLLFRRRTITFFSRVVFKALEGGSCGWPITLES